MHCQLSLVLSSILAVQSVAFSLQPRNDKLPVTVTLSPKTVPLGTTPVDVVFKNFAGACYTTGTCDQSQIEIKGYKLWQKGKNTGSNPAIAVTINPDGKFPTWIHNGLLDALHEVIKKAAVCGDVTYTTSSDVDRHGTTSPKTVNQCTIPQFISVSYTKGDAIYFMEFTSKTTAVGDVACSTVMELSGAVAGAVNGAAGGVFAFFKLACQGSAKTGN